MPFIVGEFHAVTGMCLHELQDFTGWIKKGSYYHGLLVYQGQIEECPQLIGVELPKWPQPKPSESHQDSYNRTETPVAGSSKLAAETTTAPTQETPTEEPPMVEAPVPSPSHSSPPALMETANLGSTGLRLVWKWNSGRPDPPNIPVLNPGNGTWVWRFPFPSRIRRGGMPQS